MPRQSEIWGAPELGVSGTNIGHSGTDFVGIKGISGTRYCENVHVLVMDRRIWLRAAMNGLNGKKF